MRIAALTLAPMLVFVCAAATARADPCDHATTQGELNVCAEENYKAADRSLTETWAALGRGAQSRLGAGEQGWRADRGAKCRSVAAEAKGDDIAPLVYYGCLTDWTRERVRWLRAHGVK
ncbi:MAG TPA: lysozyme inhibitor LprI family protein [Rhizomicrobium sp.]|nr:lysozyme inhibitor LprI family protein [Rhizomicrobium sp.]